MSSNTSAPESPLISVDVPDGACDDPVAEDILRVGAGVIDVLELLMDVGQDELEELGYDQTDVDRFQEAFLTFEELLDRHEIAEFRHDADVIDDDLRDELAEAFAPVAPLFVDDFALSEEEKEADRAAFLSLRGLWGRT